MAMHGLMSHSLYNKVQLLALRGALYVMMCYSCPGGHHLNSHSTTLLQFLWMAFTPLMQLRPLQNVHSGPLDILMPFHGWYSFKAYPHPQKSLFHSTQNIHHYDDDDDDVDDGDVDDLWKSSCATSHHPEWLPSQHVSIFAPVTLLFIIITSINIISPISPSSSSLGPCRPSCS